MDRVRIAIQGSGGFARHHARVCRSLEDVELVAAANWRRESLDRFAGEWDIPHTTTSFEDLAGDPEVDAVIVTLPNFQHKAEAIRMLRAGKHVLVEKPMAMNAAEAEEMLAVAQETGRVLMVGHMWRFDHEVNWLRRTIECGLLGKVVKTKGYHVNPPGFGGAGWFNEKDKAGGGVVMDMAVHSLDTTRYLLGEPQPLRVYARMGTYWSNYEVEDDATLVVDWDNGAYSTIVTAAWQPYQEEAEGAQEVWGTTGYGRLFPSKLYLPVAEVPGAFAPTFPERIAQCDFSMYRRQLEYFAGCVREGRDPTPGAAEGLVLAKIIDAAYESARTGQAVAIR